MKRNTSLILAFLLVFIVFTACSTSTPPKVEITKIVPQTVLVTQVVKETVIATLEPIKGDGTLQPTELDSKYYDGIIVIAQYYTFLGNGLYGNAYDLYSSSFKSRRSKEDFIKIASSNFKSVEIVSILPYFVEVERQGGKVRLDPENKARFAVQIRAWGEGNMSGSRINGAVQDLFLELVKENGGWKINSFATAPFP